MTESKPTAGSHHDTVPDETMREKLPEVFCGKVRSQKFMQGLGRPGMQWKKRWWV